VPAQRNNLVAGTSIITPPDRGVKAFETLQSCGIPVRRNSIRHPPGASSSWAPDFGFPKLGWKETGPSPSFRAERGI